MKNNPLVTVVTVCYNCEATIKGTIESVLMQKYDNIDYLFVDGASKDNTLKIIEEYSKIDSRIRYISEKDKGIYDAMNKGIANAKGDILFFLNSGDEFFDDKVILDIAEQFSKRDLDILYGDIVKRNDEKSFLEKQHKIDINYLLDGKMICHQSMFVSKSVFDKIGSFDLGYRISSDFEWLVRAVVKGCKLDYFDRTISYYDIEGISAQTKSRKIVWKERENAIYKNFGTLRCFALFFNQRFFRRISAKLNKQ